MEVLGIVGSIIGFFIYAALLYQQNRIMQEQNQIMRDQAGDIAGQPKPSSYKVYWPMLVMGLLTILTLGAMGFLFLHPKEKINAEGDEILTWSERKPEIVRGKNFMNEKVPLDGFEYIDCTFENVSFVYEGTTPIYFSHNHLKGYLMVGTNSKSVFNTLSFLKGIGMIPSNVPVYDLNGNPIPTVTAPTAAKP